MDLKEYIFKKNLTQKAFADLIDYNQMYFRDIFHKRKRPGKKLIRTIIKVTNGEVTENDLKWELKPKRRPNQAAQLHLE